MAIPERDRRDLFDTLEQTLGPDQADTLMQLLPNQPADELVTKTDLRVTTAELRAEMSELRTEMGEIRVEMGEIRIELKGDILRVENSLTSRIADMQVSMNRWAIGLMTANVIGVATAIAT